MVVVLMVVGRLVSRRTGVVVEQSGLGNGMGVWLADGRGAWPGLPDVGVVGVWPGVAGGNRVWSGLVV